MVVPTPHLELLNCASEAVEIKGNAVVAAFHSHADYPVSQGPTRETSTVDYLIRMGKLPRNQNLVVKEKTGDISKHEYEFWSSTLPRTWSVA